MPDELRSVEDLISFVALPETSTVSRPAIFPGNSIDKSHARNPVVLRSWQGIDELQLSTRRTARLYLIHLCRDPKFQRRLQLLYQTPQDWLHK